VILPAVHLGRDAPVAAALALALLAERGEPVSAVVDAAPRYVIVKAKLARPEQPLDRVYAGLRGRWPDAAADTQDGLRLAWPDRWIHVRPSGTEPVVRVIAEAPSGEAAQGMVDDGRQTLLTMGA
jgi:phosphomannomutase